MKQLMYENLKLSFDTHLFNMALGIDNPTYLGTRLGKYEHTLFDLEDYYAD